MARGARDDAWPDMAELKRNSGEMCATSARRKVASDRLIGETRKLVAASDACLSRSREALQRVRDLVEMQRRR